MCRISLHLCWSNVVVLNAWSQVNRLVERWTSAAAVLGLPSVEYDGASICILTSWMHVFFCEFAISGSTIHACVYDMINMLNAGSAA